MKTFIRKFFSFNRKEKRGIYILLLIVLCQISWISLYPKFAKVPFNVEKLTLEDLPVDTIRDKWKKNNYKKKIQKYPARKPAYSPRYTQYGSFPKREKEYKKVELNSSDSSALVALNGIGPFLANKIVKYRKSLGGYYELDQLQEIYNSRIDSSRIAYFKKFISVDASLVRKIKINSISVDSLKAHPYFTWTMANAVVSYRQKHGNFTGPSDLLSTTVITEDKMGRIIPYLDFSPP